MTGEKDRSTLGDYFTLQRGTTYKSRLLGQPGPVLLGLATIQRNGGFRSDSLRTYGGESPTKLLVQPGELHLSLKDVTQSADLFGAVARLPVGHRAGRLTQDTVKLEPIGDDVPVNYLYWLLRTPQYRSYCRAHATGTTNLGLAREDFLAFPAPKPTPTQRAIAHILGTLDDKIELNRRMNETLEAMAQAIFKSWFVDFDPVRAKAEGRDPGLPEHIADLFPDRFEDSELGEIPTGWRMGDLGEVVAIYDAKRVPLSGRERSGRNGPYPYYGATSIMDYVDDYLFDGIYVLVGEDGSVIASDDHPFTQYVWGKLWVNNHAHVLQGKGTVSTEHVLLSLRQTNIRAHVTGAVQLKLNQRNLKNVPFMLSSPSIHNAFKECIAPLFARMRANHDEALTLTAIRDALLPRLISGALRVPEAERMADEVLRDPTAL